MKREGEYFQLALIFLLFMIALLEAVFISLPITLVLIIILAFSWEEKVFPWAFLVGIWQDLISWRHLGIWSMVFLLVAFLVIIIRRRVLGLENNKLSLPK